MVIGQGDDLYDFWDSQETSAPGLNITGFSDPDADKILGELRTETDPVARASELSQLNSVIAADYPAAFIESPDFIYSVPKDLKGVILNPITAPSDRFANVASWYRRTASVWPFLVKTSSS
jgi:ABC-type transport system substrate-binding protein